MNGIQRRIGADNVNRKEKRKRASSWLHSRWCKDTVGENIGRIKGGKMTKEDLRDAMHSSFTSEYYASNLCQLADNANYEMCQYGKINIEDAVYELLESLSDSAIETMEESNVLTAKKQECKSNMEEV